MSLPGVTNSRKPVRTTSGHGWPPQSVWNEIVRYFHCHAGFRTVISAHDLYTFDVPLITSPITGKWVMIGSGGTTKLPPSLSGSPMYKTPDPVMASIFPCHAPEISGRSGMNNG